MQYLSTLGYLPNPLLEKYLLAFHSKLELLWEKNIWWKIPPKEFLLYPDIHGLILVSARPWSPDALGSIQILKEEYQKFLKGDGIQIPKLEKCIPNTTIELTTEFHNVDIDAHTHPEHIKKWIHVSFWEISENEWKMLMEKSFDIVRKVSPTFMHEIEHIVKKIIPFGVSPWVHNSWSYSDFIGHLIMSYPTGLSNPELALLEAILHEYNHNKLNLIMQTEILLLNDRREIYYSPYRPDVRHIHWIYLWLHALAGAFWVLINAHVKGVIQLPDMWLEKVVLYILKNGLSIQVLEKYGKYTPVGKDIFEEMKCVHIECLRYIKLANIPQEVIDRARVKLIKHFEEVNANYPIVLS